MPVRRGEVTVAHDEAAPERFRLLKLAWEYACDSFGSRQLLFEITRPAE
jgi:aromatic ring hydroxylase